MTLDDAISTGGDAVSVPITAGDAVYGSFPTAAYVPITTGGAITTAGDAATSNKPLPAGQETGPERFRAGNDALETEGTAIGLEAGTIAGAGTTGAGKGTSFRW